MAWDRVRGNKGARTAGVDGRTAASIVARVGVEVFLDELRSSVEGPQFPAAAGAGADDPEAGRQAAPVWGSPTITDRVVQASLKLVLEPIFEADFLPCSYGFRPGRRTHDAVAEVRVPDVEATVL